MWVGTSGIGLLLFSSFGHGKIIIIMSIEYRGHLDIWGGGGLVETYTLIQRPGAFGRG